MKTQAGLHRTSSRKAPAKLIMAAMAIAFLSGCAAVGGGASQMQNSGEASGGEPRTSEQTPSPETGSTTAGGNAVDAPGEPRTEPEEAAPVQAAPGQAAPGQAVVSLTGTRGARFSGECRVGGETESIGGELPERLDFDLADGGELACDIEKQDPGQMRMVFSTQSNNVVQTTGADNTTISLVYRDGSVSIFQSASSSSGIQQSSGTSVTQSNVIVQNGSATN